MDPDIKTSHLFLPMKKLFIIRDICEGTYGSLITRNNMTSDGYEHKTEWRIENETEWHIHEHSLALSLVFHTLIIRTRVSKRNEQAHG